MLDTHALLWYFHNSPKLPDTIADIIENTNVQKFIIFLRRHIMTYTEAAYENVIDLAVVISI